MKKQFFPLLLLSATLFAIPTMAQQLECPALVTTSRLSLQPFIGLSYPLIGTRIQERVDTLVVWNAEEPQVARTYSRDEHNSLPGLEAGFRTQLQLNKKWAIRAETGIQQLFFRRKLYYEQEMGTHFSSRTLNSDIRLLYFYQSLETSYSISDKLSASIGGYAATLLSSNQNWPLFVPEGGLTPDQEEVKKAGYGLRDTQLGLQASLTYQFYKNFTATANVRQSLQSIYSAEAQPAGAIRPISFSLTVGYKLQIK